MAGRGSIVWTFVYWLIVVCGVLLILSSFFPGVKANTGSLQPVITHPAGGTVHEAVTGSQLTLMCEVSRGSLDGMIHVWWCNSSVSDTCHTTVQTFNANDTTSPRLWISYTPDNGTEASVVAPADLGTLDKEASGTYYCAAYHEGSGTTPSVASISLRVNDAASPVPQVTPKETITTEALNFSQANPKPTSEPTGKPMSPSSSAAVIAAVVIIIILIIATIIIVVWFCKFRRQPCIKGHKVKARHSSKNESFTSDGGINGFGMTPVQAEMQPFIMRHRCDIFIHHHGTDLTLAEMMRSKLLDQESHLHVMLWSEVAGTGRESRPSTKRLALSLVHSTTVVLLVSWKYLQHESQRFRLALSRIPRKVDSVRQKVVIVRRIEEEKVPQDLKTGIMNSLEYNVDTDSKFFWPRFNRAVIPQRDDMLYWRT